MCAAVIVRQAAFMRVDLEKTQKQVHLLRDENTALHGA
jgi:hypothetical protein